MGSAWINANQPMEDRHSLHYLGQEHGVLVAVFDGHSGFETSDILSHYLATYVQRHLDKIQSTQGTTVQSVSEALAESFLEFDHDLTEKIPTAAIQVGFKLHLHFGS